MELKLNKKGKNIADSLGLSADREMELDILSELALRKHETHTEAFVFMMEKAENLNEAVYLMWSYGTSYGKLSGMGKLHKLLSLVTK